MNAKQLIKDRFPVPYDFYVEYKDRKLYNSRKKLANISPETLVKFVYNKAFGKDIDLNNPKTFNEKLNWLKLYWYDEQAETCSDKYLVREFVEKKGLGHLLNELYAVYDKPEEINPDVLPDKFILKCSHDSGHSIICTDKSKINWKQLKRKFKWWFKINYCFMAGEWPYYTEHPSIVCEKFLEDPDMGELLDYKFFCFNGEPEMVFFASDRKHHVRADFYDLNWKLLPFRWLYEPSGKAFPKPSRLDDMIKYAKILSEGFPFVRVDFYEIQGKVIFGELTFFHGGASGWFRPEKIDYELGQKIILPPKSNPWEHIR